MCDAYESRFAIPHPQLTPYFRAMLNVMFFYDDF